MAVFHYRLWCGIYEILKDGHLKPINMAGINGMRGCYLSQIMKIVSCSWQAGMTARSQRCV
ncbi:MAG: hypothetical protein ACLURV_06320 [Gallintestinimicrobium sp.]